MIEKFPDYFEEERKRNKQANLSHYNKSNNVFPKKINKSNKDALNFTTINSKYAREPELLISPSEERRRDDNKIKQTRHGRYSSLSDCESKYIQLN